METRRLFVALTFGLAAFLVYRVVYDKLFPPVEMPAQQSVATAPETANQPSPATKPVMTEPTGSAPATTQATPPATLIFVDADAVEQHTLGGTAEDKLLVELDARGATIERLLLCEQKDGKYVHRLDEKTFEPYVLLKPIELPEGEYASYITRQIWVNKQALALDRVVWKLTRRSKDEAEFATVLRDTETGEDRLRITKRYTLEPGTARILLALSAENLSDAPLELQLEQDGPVGVLKENSQYNMRKLIRARREEQDIDPKAYARKELQADVQMGSSANQFVWTALCNKYFAVFTRPLPRAGQATADYLGSVVGHVVINNLTGDDPGDYLARMLTLPEQIEPREKTEYTFEIYAGTKGTDDLAAANPDYIDRSKIGYIAARDADQRCCCTFPTLTGFMTGCLEMIQTVVRNYGIAIIILVLIIRTLLHPLAVFQQKSMYRMQEAQARIKPKIDAIKERFANDKVRLNQETMKLYGEEGVNPMASMVGMLPMMIQMPILIALWTALNTDVHLRHAGFDPWWITDLSAPDRLIEFGGAGLTIPILSMLPLVGRMFTNIPSLNLLPVLMGVSMWLQQKYMPKPGMDAKREAAKKAAAEKSPHHKASGLSPQDQARQQQMMMYMMSIMFPLMFYYWPSGLNLYWMATNVFGIAESIRIRGQIKAEQARRDLLGPQPRPKKKAGPLARFFKHMADKAEELQKKADQMGGDEKKKG